MLLILTTWVRAYFACTHTVERDRTVFEQRAFGENRGGGVATPEMSAGHPAEIVRSTSRTEAHAIFIRRAFPRKLAEMFAKHETP